MTTVALGLLTEARGRQQGLDSPNSCPLAASRQAPALLRRPRHHTSWVPKSLRLPRRHVLRALALLRWTRSTLLYPHCTPGSSPCAYKRKDQGPLREGWPRGDEDETGARLGLLAPSPAWTLVSPYCKRTRLRRGANTKAAGSTLSCLPPSGCLLSPLRVPPCVDPSGLGHAATIHSSVQGPPGFETPTVGAPGRGLLRVDEQLL